ncbi:MAG: glycoside hydrolase family 130 protein [Kiritimatiellae bacterium]|nr:glycoside hydrolase family 130 protein [Kiritimatiellia bacterium]
MSEESLADTARLPIIKDAGIALSPDNRRVLLRPHLPANPARIKRIIMRVMALGEAGAEEELAKIMYCFSARHRDFKALLERRFEAVRAHMPPDREFSLTRKNLAAAYFLAEHSFESTALFNPSIIPHPDQSGVPPGALRFILSLRATGEGHVSSLTFRSGMIGADESVAVDEASTFACSASLKPDALYNKTCFARKLQEMGQNNGAGSIMEPLPDEFTMAEMEARVNARLTGRNATAHERAACEKIMWLAQCNYEASFNPQSALSERVLFPFSPSEQNGMEDARFVLFTDNDNSRKYYATYTAYDGRNILPQIIETEDFVNFKMITLNGRGAVNKGMALFPRKLNGRYAMVSRNDNENLFMMYSDNLHFWHEAVPFMRPFYPWELVQIGNCGSPIETDRGWLLLTHGVGPLRQYSIGAVLLDRENPERILGRLSEPLLRWDDNNRSGYVPNVVYSCGALIHANRLVIPYALADNRVRIAQTSAAELISRMRSP